MTLSMLKIDYVSNEVFLSEPRELIEGLPGGYYENYETNETDETRKCPCFVSFVPFVGLVILVIALLNGNEMNEYISFILRITPIIQIIEGRGPHLSTMSHHYHPQPSMQKKLTDEKLLHDKHHIDEKLLEWSDNPYQQLTVEEIEFRYFKVHDFDNNTKLDGLEMYQAILHTMHDRWTDKENIIVELIDQILHEDDIDNDGYLSYAEYVVGRQKEKNDFFDISN